jgi:holo-[acyl-carrier protein] synthase
MKMIGCGIVIFGNGVDLLEIDRIKALLDKNPRFLERFFTEDECVFFEKKMMNIETIAANFAAKEAVSKAFGTGVRGFNLIDIEILRDEMGKPIVNLYNGAQILAESLEIDHIMLSISHTEKYAVAFAIAMKKL